MVSLKRESDVVSEAGDRKRGKTAVEAKVEAAAPKPPSSDMVVRTVVRESHDGVIRKVAYWRRSGGAGSADDSEDASNLFATVGKDQCTVYDGRHFGKYVGLVVRYTHDAKDAKGSGVNLTCCAWTDARGRTNHPKGDEHLVVGDAKGSILLISVVEAAVIRKMDGHAKEITHLATSASKPGLLLSLSRDGEARLWNVYEERCLCTFDVGTAASCVAWSPRGDSFLVGTTSGGIQRWPIPWCPDNAVETTTAAVKKVSGRTFEKAAPEGVAHAAEIDCAIFLGGAAEASRVVTKSVDGRIFLWDAEADRRLKAWKIPGSVRTTSDISASSDGKFLVAGNAEGQVFVMDLDLTEDPPEGSSGSKTTSKFLAKLDPYESRMRARCPGQVVSCAISDDHQDVVATLGDAYLFRYRHMPPSQGTAAKEVVGADQEKNEQQEEK